MNDNTTEQTDEQIDAPESMTPEQEEVFEEIEKLLEGVESPEELPDDDLDNDDESALPVDSSQEVGEELEDMEGSDDLA